MVSLVVQLFSKKEKERKSYLSPFIAFNGGLYGRKDFNIMESTMA